MLEQKEESITVPYLAHDEEIVTYVLTTAETKNKLKG
jgi:hypothetical protein